MLLALLTADGGRIDNRIAEAHLVAIACIDPPEGHTHWTLNLLEDKAEELGYVESIARETVRQVLRKGELRPWRNREWRISELRGEFVVEMEDGLNLTSHRGYTYWLKPVWILA